MQQRIDSMNQYSQFEGLNKFNYKRDNHSDLDPDELMVNWKLYRYTVDENENKEEKELFRFDIEKFV